MRGVRAADGRIVIVDGPTLYEAKSDGTLVLDSYGEITTSSFFTLRGGKVGTPIPTSLNRPRWYRDHVLAWDYEGGRFRWADDADLPVPRVPEGVTLDPDEVHHGPNGTLIAFVRARRELNSSCGRSRPRRTGSSRSSRAAARIDRRCSARCPCSNECRYPVCNALNDAAQ